MYDELVRKFYMLGKVLKSSFQQKKRWVNQSFIKKVMAVFLPGVYDEKNSERDNIIKVENYEQPRFLQNFNDFFTRDLSKCKIRDYSYYLDL